jgi:hypothetical protein
MSRAATATSSVRLVRREPTADEHGCQRRQRWHSLVWLGLYLPALAPSPTVTAQTVTQPVTTTEAAATPGREALPPPTTDVGNAPWVGEPALTTLLQHLDAAFRRGDSAAWLREFEPDHPGSHAQLQLQLERMLAATPQRTCRSEIVGAPWQVGPRTLVRVRRQVQLLDAGPDGASAGEPRASFTESLLLACRTGAAGQAIPTFAIEVPADYRPQQTGVHCPPCNYRVGGVAGWLCVPVRNDRARALEAASFFLVGTDLACDVTVEVETGRDPAAAVATALGGALRSLEPSARPEAAEPWLPPFCRSAAASVPKLDAARVAVDLPDCGADGSRALFHVTELGGLRHLLLLRGRTSSLRAHDAAVQALLASYRVLDPATDGARRAAESLEHHVGGVCADGAYTNALYGVELRGPRDWSLQQRAGGAAFRALWTSRDGSRMWLTGHRVPPGMDRWCRPTAERWLQHLCEQQQLALPGGEPFLWREPAGRGEVPCGGVLAFVAKPKAADAERPQGGTGQPLGAARPQLPRRLRVQLHDDLLLIADGFAATAADEQALLEAMATLRRR